MPFYEYRCKSCGHDLEAMQKISEAPLKKCPHCGKSQLQRLMSAPVFRLKGGGWYETDFKGDKDNQRNLADRPEADAPKELPKDATKDAAKDGAAGKTETDGAKDAPVPKETTADKPEKAAESSKKLDLGKESARKGSARGRTGSRHKAAAKRSVRKPAPKRRR
jgi:putative FmdB family regulatory protein